MAEKAELIITALQQRIGEIVSNYETQIAIYNNIVNTDIHLRQARKRYIQYQDFDTKYNNKYKK